jgi:rhodanese-related sulfurtransferase
MLTTIPELLSQVKKNITCITAEQALPLIKQKDSLLIDVREPNEVEQQAVIGAINIPRGVLEMKMLNLHPDENKQIVVHCATSARASLAAEQLQRIGYKNVAVISCKIETICECFQLS